MHKNMTDAELKEAMKVMARVAGLDLSPERIEIDFPAFKSQLDAIDAVNSVALAWEDEPNHVFRLKKIQR
jgi:hypothetical protein